MKYCVVYLASQYDSKLSTGQYRFDMLCESLKNTSRIFGDKDYIIFHEDLKEEHKDRIKSINKNVAFEELDFIREELDFVKFGRPKGYMLMCRFFSGELQKYLLSKNYEAYIRFDDDSFLLEPYLDRQKLENEMNDNGYIYRTLFRDGQLKFNGGVPMQSLYDFTKLFLTEKGLKCERIYPYLQSIGFIDNNMLYTGLSPYNNFHACQLSIWTNPLVEEYVQTLMDVNGCLMNFWMDANIHSMIIFMLLPFTENKSFLKTDFGYRHNRHFSQMNSPGLQYRNDEPFFPVSG